MRLLVKPWKNREDGRILLVNHNKVVFSCHFRNMEHRSFLIEKFTKIKNR